MTEKILNIVSHNARLTNAQIAVMLGVSEKEVSDEIQRLEASGMIKGYVAKLNDSGKFVKAFIRIKVSSSKYETEVAESLLLHPLVDSIYLISASDYDLQLVAKAEKMEDISEFLANVVSQKEGVERTETNFAMTKYKDDGIVFMEENPVKREDL